MANTTREFYLARADDCARDAASANLENVRDRALRSEAAWRDMAARVERVAEARAATEVARQANQAAVAAANASLTLPILPS